MKTPTIRPTGDRVLLRPLPRPEKTEGGLHLPGAATRGRQDRAEVVAVGPGKVTQQGDRTPMGVSVGDIVIFNAYAGQAVDREGSLLLTRMGEVVAVVDAED